MPERNHWPCALTIAGSDSGGGAGIQADLKTFASLRVHGTSAITCLTAQNPKGVRGIQAATPSLLRQQIDAVLEELHPRAIKTGMLFSARLIRAVVEGLSIPQSPPLIVDPVMVATSGARLLQASAIKALQNDLLPRALLVTPNLAEAEVLTGGSIRSPDEAAAAAAEICRRYGCAALVKGGHFHKHKESSDFYNDGSTEWVLPAPRIRGVSTHGTGCTFSAAITAYVALGNELPAAIRLAKTYMTRTISQSINVGKHTVLNCFWQK